MKRFECCCQNIPICTSLVSGKNYCFVFSLEFDSCFYKYSTNVFNVPVLVVGSPSSWTSIADNEMIDLDLRKGFYGQCSLISIPAADLLPSPHAVATHPLWLRSSILRNNWGWEKRGARKLSSIYGNSFHPSKLMVDPNHEVDSYMYISL